MKASTIRSRSEVDLGADSDTGSGAGFGTGLAPLASERAPGLGRDLRAMKLSSTDLLSPAQCNRVRTTVAMPGPLSLRALVNAWRLRQLLSSAAPAGRPCPSARRVRQR